MRSVWWVRVAGGEVKGVVKIRGGKMEVGRVGGGEVFRAHSL